MGLLDVLTAHSDTIIIALITAVPGAIAAFAAILNRRAVAKMHACLDDHVEKMDAAVGRADAHRGTAPSWDGVERRVGLKDRRHQ